MDMGKWSRWASVGKVAILITGIIVMTSCAAMDKNECLNADWYSIGFEDGAKGYKASKISRLRKACAKHGVAPDFATYERGRLKGLEEWCTPRNGYYWGEAGRSYNDVCPDPLERAFVRAYKKGRTVYSYKTKVNKTKRDLNRLYDEMANLETDLAHMEDELVSQGVSPRRRRQLLEDIRVLEDDHRALQDDITEMEVSLNDIKVELNRLKDQNPYR